MIVNTKPAFNPLPPAPAKRKPLATTRAADGAEKAPLTATGKQLAVSEDNFTAAASQIPDVDAALASTESARRSILGQPAMALLAQANSIPQAALRLLQQ
jgi:flagellin